jgi:hypothetical protein
MTHLVYLNSEGVTIGAGSDDATQNLTPITSGAVTLVPYLQADAQRTVKIADIVAQLDAILGPYGVYLTTTRPASGPYDMIVLTDDGSAKVSAGNNGISSMTSLTCNATPSVIGFQFGGFQRDYVVRDVIAMLGIIGGIPHSNKANDCMCFVDAVCNTVTAPCTIGGASTPIGSTPGCGTDTGTMDEAARFLATFGPR